MRKYLAIALIAMVAGLWSFGIVNADNPNYFKQCANGTASPFTCLPGTNWTGGALNTSNSHYTEGVAVPQKILFRGITGTVHYIGFQMSWTRAGKHTYDFPTSWAQAEQTHQSVFSTTLKVLGSECSGMGGADLTACTQVVSGTGHVATSVPVPEDPFVSGVFAAPATGSTQAKINAFETAYGNRTITVYTMVPVTASMAMSHTVSNGCDFAGAAGPCTLGPNDNSDTNWTIQLSSSSPITQVLVTFAAHAALGNPFGDPSANGVGWGYGTGANTVSGAPYHVNNPCIDSYCFGGGGLDNQMQLSQAPTAVGLSSFGAAGTTGGVALQWRTGSEVNTAGFNIYRSDDGRDGPYKRINTLMVAAENALVGAKYEFLDTTTVAGKTYFYQLEDVELNGTSERHSPIAVSVPSAEGFSLLHPLQLWTIAAAILMLVFLVVGAILVGVFLHSPKLLRRS